MMYWALLTCAVLSNVMANVAFKLTMTSVREDIGLQLVVSVLKTGWFWLAVGSCCLLLASYLLALRQLGLSASYAVVTSSAIVGICIASTIVFNEQLTVVKAIGVAAIVFGLCCIVHEEVARLQA